MSEFSHSEPAPKNPVQITAAMPFSFESKPVRVIEQMGEPWFVAPDVCRVLEISDVTSALRALDEDEKGPLTVRTPGGDQQVNCISEPGLYKLLGRSRKPEAKRFDRWVRHEVLPSIRKTGGYQAPMTREQQVAHALLLTQEIIKEKDEQIALLLPKAEALDRISAGADNLTMTQAAKILGMKQADTKRWMHANRWIYPQNGSWLAYAHQIQAGCLEYKEHHFTDKETGDQHSKPYCHVTPKGLAKLAKNIPFDLRTEPPAGGVQ